LRIIEKMIGKKHQVATLIVGFKNVASPCNSLLPVRHLPSGDLCMRQEPQHCVHSYLLFAERHSSALGAQSFGGVA
jgi:hypothetical protein